MTVGFSADVNIKRAVVFVDDSCDLIPRHDDRSRPFLSLTVIVRKDEYLASCRDDGLTIYRIVFQPFISRQNHPTLFAAFSNPHIVLSLCCKAVFMQRYERYSYSPQNAGEYLPAVRAVEEESKWLRRL